MVQGLVDEERRKYRADSRSNSSLWRMEKRIEKLYGELTALENALQLLSNAKVPNSAMVMNALRQLGILQEDKNFEKKREMLKVVLETNRGIRSTARDLEARGITLSSPLRESSTLPAQ
jgi:hypothetical protein